MGRTILKARIRTSPGRSTVVQQIDEKLGSGEGKSLCRSATEG